MANAAVPTTAAALAMCSGVCPPKNFGAMRLVVRKAAEVPIMRPQLAIRRIEKWVMERTQFSDGLAAIYPSMQYAIMMMDVLGYAPSNTDRMEAEKQFNNLMVNSKGEFFMQPCFSARACR